MTKYYKVHLGLVFVLALLIRLAISTLTIAYHPDEIWQYLEPAYGLITGHWIVTWEFRLGARSWLVPELLAVPMWFGHVIAPQSQWHLILARAFLACWALAIPLAFYWLGKRIGATHAFVAFFVGAFWAEIVYFAPRALSDSIACTLAFPAICAAYRMRESHSRFVAPLAGFLVALCFVIRFQLGPPLLVLSIWAMWRVQATARLAFIGGVALALAADTIANLAQGAPPFAWIAHNLLANFRDGRAAYFGTEPPYWYLVQILLAWKAGAFLIIPAAALGSRRYPIVLLMALIVLVVHSMIPHKELRFILPAQMFLIFLASIGTTDMAKFLSDRLDEPFPHLAVAFIPLWLMMSASVAWSFPFKENWSRGRPLLSMEVAAGQDPSMCAVAVVTPDIPAPSYAFFNRPAPVYFVDGPEMARRLTPNIDTLVAPSRLQHELPKAYRLSQCSFLDEPVGEKRFCTFVRAGGCSAVAPAWEYNQVLIRRQL